MNPYSAGLEETDSEDDLPMSKKEEDEPNPEKVEEPDKVKGELREE